MNPFIKSDVRNGLIFLECGIMNALADLETGEKLIDFGELVPRSLIEEYADKRNWIVLPNIMITPNKKVIKIENGQKTILVNYG